VWLALSGGFFLGGTQAALAGVVAPQSTAPETAKGAQQGTKNKDALDEVIIRARKEKLSVLLEEIEHSADRFFEAYNQINTKPEYKVSCGMEVHAGSWIHAHECKPQFYLDATAEDARDFLASMTTPGAGVGASAGPIIAAKLPDFRKHLVAVINRNPSLVKLLREHAALEQHYQEVRKLKFKGR
jgi:hypothetical protein